MLPPFRLDRAAKSACRMLAATLARRASPIYDVRARGPAATAGGRNYAPARLRLSVPPLMLAKAAASRCTTTDPPTLGERLARHVRKARLPRSAQAGRRRDHVRKSRHHRIAVDGRVRDRERAALPARLAG